MKLSSFNKSKRSVAGFTLIEILVVIAIIGFLAAMVAPNIIGRQSDAQIKIAKTQISNIKNALNMYKVDNSIYPTTDQGLKALVEKPASSPEPRNWNSPYMEKLPKDPWGYDFVYFRDGAQIEILSYGADGQEGGEGENADISSLDI